VSKLRSPVERSVPVTKEALTNTDSVTPSTADPEAGLPFDTNADGTIKIIRLPNGGIKITANEPSSTPQQQEQDQ